MTSRGEEIKAAWAVSELQREGVTASEKSGGFRIEEVREKDGSGGGRERERGRAREIKIQRERERID